MRCLDDIICKAKGCSAYLGAKYAKAFTYGENTEEMKYELMRLNGYIRTLSRNHETIKYKKEKVKVTSVNIDSLTRKNSSLYLKCDTKTVCTKTVVSPCLSDSEIDRIIEQINTICRECDCCNCN